MARPPSFNVKHISEYKSRFMKRTRLNESGCIEWHGPSQIGGMEYGVCLYNGKIYKAHRLSWLIHKQELPSDLLVCHKCDNPKCVNPDHLFLGTAKDNMDDCISKGRWPIRFGEKCPSRKLNLASVLEIKKRLKLGHKQMDLARDFGISQSVISQIKRGITWHHQERMDN